MNEQAFPSMAPESVPSDSILKGAKTTMQMKKILLIDDDPDMVTVLELLLKRNGYEVATAHKEADVYTLVDSFKPHVIIMDVLLSGSDGRTICKKLKTSGQWKHIPVIMFSAHPGAQKNMADFGADDFIPKPFQSDKLLERIQVQLNQPR